LQTYRNLFFGGAVSPAGDQQLLGYLARPFVDYASDRLAAGREGELITDENMVTEFRRGTPF
jgi:hypothetical protein